MSKGAQWFASRMPSPAVLDDLLTGDPVRKLVTITRDRAIANPGFDLRAKPDTEHTEEALKVALAAAQRLAREGDQAALTPDEEAALELFILLVARPSLFVRDGRVMGDADNWPEIRTDRDLFPSVTAGVGRIQLSDGTKIGTGFIAGKDRVLTNNHVVCALLGEQLCFWKKDPGRYGDLCTKQNELWEKTAGARPVFELVGEVESTDSDAVRIARIRAHHGKVDMAVLELEKMPRNGSRLPLANIEPKRVQGAKVFVVGYPVDDSRDWLGKRITPAPIFRRVYGTDDATLGTKRLAPGLILGGNGDDEFLHDASTLPGSSGSCIVDFTNHRVIGLHYGGSFADERNYAVRLWRFCNDPLLVDNGIVFA
jgi:V8-like Glu-specific endopeptidase